ncbi:MAG: phosphatase PAP2 family protein [Tepidisphaeraceae bacterium]
MSHPQSRWAAASAIRATVSQFRESLSALPAGTWRRWLVALLIGWTICAAMVVGITKYAQSASPRWLQDWDERTLRAIERGPMSFQNAILLESPGNLIYLIPLVACVAIVAIRRRQPVFAVTIVASYVLARTVVVLGWKLWDRPRPDLIAGGVAAPPLHSFPSGHIVLALSVYGLLAYAWIRSSRSVMERTLAIVLTAAWCASTGLARVRLGSHWPSDVIAGAVIGLAWLGVMVFALRRARTLSWTADASP